MQHAGFLALLTALVVGIAGCLGAENPLSPATTDDVKDLVLDIQLQPDGSYKMKVPAVGGFAYTWDLGDLATKTGAEITHKYAVKNGIMSVVLTAKKGTEVVRLGKQLAVGNGQNAAPTAALALAAPIVKAGEAFLADGASSKDADGDALKVTWLLAPASEAPAAGGGDEHAGHMLSTTASSDMGAPAAGAGAARAGSLDTGNLKNGETKELAFAMEGTYQMHCHPHPWMISKVQVVKGAPSTATVEIEQSAFLPAIVKIAPGGKVKYVNKDAVVHTATQGAFVPAGKLLATGTAKDLVANLTIAEKGTFDLVLAIEDGKGQTAVAKKRITVGDETPSSTFEETFEDGFAGPFVSAAGTTNAKRHPFQIDYPGHAIIAANTTAGTPTYGALSFRLLDGAGTEIASGTSMETPIPAGPYFIEVAPVDPVIANIDYAVHVLVHLDLSGGAAEEPEGGGEHQH